MVGTQVNYLADFINSRYSYRAIATTICDRRDAIIKMALDDLTAITLNFTITQSSNMGTVTAALLPPFLFRLVATEPLSSSRARLS